MMSELFDTLLETLLHTEHSKFQEAVHQLYQHAHQRSVGDFFQPDIRTIAQDVDLRSKLSRTYTLYLDRLSRLNPLSLYETLPNSIKVVCQIDPRVWIALLPIAYGFTRDYLNAFQSQKIDTLPDDKLWGEIPRLFYPQKSARIEKQYWHWIEHAESLSKHYNAIREHKSLWEEITSASQGVNDTLDYLRSPLDENAIESIYARLKTPLDPTLAKAIIQEKMVDFIAHHLCFQGFIYHSSQEEYIRPHLLAALPFTLTLTRTLREYAANAEKWEETDRLIQSISREVIFWYQHHVRSFFIDYYGLNTLRENPKLIQMMQNLILKLNADQPIDENLDHLSLILQERLSRLVLEDMYNFNSEDAFVFHLITLLPWLKE